MEVAESTVPRKTRQCAREDDELAAMKKIGFILDQLPVGAAERVLLYVSSKQAERRILAKTHAKGSGDTPPTPSDSDALRATF